MYTLYQIICVICELIAWPFKTLSRHRDLRKMAKDGYVYFQNPDYDQSGIWVHQRIIDVFEEAWDRGLQVYKETIMDAWHRFVSRQISNVKYADTCRKARNLYKQQGTVFQNIQIAEGLSPFAARIVKRKLYDRDFSEILIPESLEDDYCDTEARMKNVTLTPPALPKSTH